MRNSRKLKSLLVDVLKGESAKDSLGGEIAKFRQDNTLTQKDLAALLEISPQHLSDIEASRRGLSETLVERLREVVR